MKKLLGAFLVFATFCSFATSAVDQEAAQAAMKECLKTKTQQECNAAQKSAEAVKTKQP